MVVGLFNFYTQRDKKLTYEIFFVLDKDKVSISISILHIEECSICLLFSFLFSKIPWSSQLYTLNYIPLLFHLINLDNVCRF